MNNYLESTIYTAVRVVGSITPFFLLAALIYFNGKQPPELSEIIGNGELAIVCITLGIGAIYSLVNNAYKIGNAVYKTTSYIGLHFVFWPTILLLMIGVTIYSSGLKDVYLSKSSEDTEIVDVQSSQQNQKNVKPSDDKTANELTQAEKGRDRIVTFSIWFFLWIILAVFVSRMFDKIDVKFVQERTDDVNNLQNKVEHG
jgi:hypothetical protein